MLSLFYSLLSVFIVSLLSFFGVFALSVNEDLLHKILFFCLVFLVEPFWEQLFSTTSRSN